MKNLFNTLFHQKKDPSPDVSSVIDRFNQNIAVNGDDGLTEKQRAQFFVKELQKEIPDQDVLTQYIARGVSLKDLSTTLVSTGKSNTIFENNLLSEKILGWQKYVKTVTDLISVSDVTLDQTRFFDNTLNVSLHVSGAFAEIIQYCHDASIRKSIENSLVSNKELKLPKKAIFKKI